MSVAGESSTSGSAKTPVANTSGQWMTWVLIGGVILPAITVAVELLTRMCSFIFDPIPTPWHLALLLTVPLANLAALQTCRRRDDRYAALVALMLGVAIGVASIYSIALLPLLPFSLLAMIFYGIGILILSPYLSLWASISSNLHLRKVNGVNVRKNTKTLWGGIALSLVLLIGYAVSISITNTGLRMARSHNEETSRRGIRLIRSFGNKTALLRACYELPTGFWVLDGMFTPSEDRVSRDDAREAYYRVMGKPFNSVAPPRLFGLRSRLTEDFEFDSDIGGTAVNGKVRSLSMETSRMDTIVEPDSLTAYTEWTMVFKNSAQFDQREARAEIALPPGGAVSRLTLWVNGEEREAAFSTRGKVRQAYQEVAVVQRRDPVLVTSCGPDRVLVQCFPVPPNGGTMKIRLGVTSPLRPEWDSAALLVLPRFVEKNFGIPDGVEHSIYVSSPQSLSFREHPALGNSVREQITDSELSGSKGVIVCTRNPRVKTVWTPDTVDPEHYAIVQTVAENVEPGLKSAVIVIDGSASMADARGDIAEAIKILPRKCRFTVIQAGDEVTQLTPMKLASKESLDDAARKISGMRCVGGVDNRDALIRACELSEGAENGAVLWIHGPQPLVSGAKTEQLIQMWERQPKSFKIVSVAAVDGRNSILADLEHTGAVTVVPRFDTLARDLGRLIGSWNEGYAPTVAATWKRVPLSRVTGVRGSSHIARLWARAEVLRICRLADSRLIPDASLLAARHQIVTPISGAVVLENEQQYKQSGLKAVNPTTVPSTVPEPSTLAALTLGLVSLGALRRRRK